MPRQKSGTAIMGGAVPHQSYKPRIAAEWMPHAATLIAWPWRPDIWGQYLRRAQQAIERLVLAIAEWEPVILLVPPGKEIRPLSRLVAGLPVELVPFQYDDIWLRDTTPLWLDNGRAIDPGFNGWGNKANPQRSRQEIPHCDDAALALRLCNAWGIDRIQTGLVLEGGSVEADGMGTLLSTASNLFHPMRNGSLSPATVVAALNHILDVSLVILPGFSSADDITDGHVDGLARFGPAGRLIIDEVQPDDLDNPELAALMANREALLQLLPHHDPLIVRRPYDPGNPRRFHAYHGETFTYLNYYSANGGLVLPTHGRGAESADAAAAAVLGSAYGLSPDRVKTIDVDGITLYGGGGIHCVTREIPAALGFSAGELAERLRDQIKKLVGLNGAIR